MNRTGVSAVGESSIISAEAQTPWRLRATPELKRLAGCFSDDYFALCAPDDGMEPAPAIIGQSVLITFSQPLKNTRTEALIQQIAAASRANLTHDLQRYAKLALRLRSLSAEARSHLRAAPTGGTGIQLRNLIHELDDVEQRVAALGEPAYTLTAGEVDGELPDWVSIGPRRRDYIAKLSRLESDHDSLGNRLRGWTHKARPLATTAPPKPFQPLQLQDALRPTQQIVSVEDFLGGPLCRLVASIGNPGPQTKSLPLGESWRSLLNAYHELHLESGLVEFRLIGIGESDEDPLRRKATKLLERGYKRLLKFVAQVVSVGRETLKATEKDSVPARSGVESIEPQPPVAPTPTQAEPQPPQVAPPAQAVPPTTQVEQPPPQSEPTIAQVAPAQLQQAASSSSQVAPAIVQSASSPPLEPPTKQGEQPPPPTEPQPAQQVAPSTPQASPTAPQLEQPPAHTAPSSTQVAPSVAQTKPPAPHVAPTTRPDELPSQPLEPATPKVASRQIQFDEVAIGDKTKLRVTVDGRIVPNKSIRVQGGLLAIHFLRSGNDPKNSCSITEFLKAVLGESVLGQSGHPKKLKGIGDSLKQSYEIHLRLDPDSKTIALPDLIFKTEMPNDRLKFFRSELAKKQGRKGK